MQEFVFNNIFNFYKACGDENLDQDFLDSIKAELRIKNDIPIVFVPLLSYLFRNDPQYYWNKSVAIEIHNNLSSLYEINNDIFLNAFYNSLEYMFSAYKAYDVNIELINEVGDVAFSEELKNTLYRNTIYTRLCEDCLMNFYRFFRDIINCFSEKDYSTQSTLTPVINVLRKYNFIESTNIDIDLRNAINHGNLFTNNYSVTYRFSNKKNEYEEKELKNFEYDTKINETLDMSSGIIIGLISFLSENPALIGEILSYEMSEELLFEWVKLTYRSKSTKLLFFSKSIIGKPQLSLTIKTTISDQNILLFTLAELLKTLFLFFPNYDKYLIGYNHNRSPKGFIQINRSDIANKSQNIENADILKIAIDKKSMLIWDILQNDVDERLYKFQVFPLIEGDGWKLKEVKDCSIQHYKRISANLVFDQKYSKSKIKKIIPNVLEKMYSIKTLQNPVEDVPWGSIPANIIYLHVFYKSTRRNSYSLYPNNKHFICTVNYYENESCPRLDNGGLPDIIWSQLKKAKIRNMEFAWNPNYKGENSKVR